MVNTVRCAAVALALLAAPAALAADVEAGRLKANTCYVWRVWPYVGDKFAPKALGVSNFCTARASVIRRAKAGATGTGGARR